MTKNIFEERQTIEQVEEGNDLAPKFDERGAKFFQGQSQAHGAAHAFNLLIQTSMEDASTAFQ